MKPLISKFLRKYSYATTDINKLLVSTYLYINGIIVNNNIFIRNLLLENDDTNVIKFSKLINNYYKEFNIELLIELFEFVISPEEKEVNGAVYTPKHIREYIIQESLNQFPQNTWRNLKIADISCGCGGFFVSVAEHIKHAGDHTYNDIYRNLYGVDIEEYSIERTKILLSLNAIQNGEDIENFDFNLFCGNSLSFDWNTIPGYQVNNGFDIVIGNPPYVSSSKISDESRELLNQWEVTRTGKTDLYIPFFQIAIECLNQRGILGYITVNNFYRSVNGRAFRRYMSNNGYRFRIIDFGAEQVFKGRSTYTCICLIEKQDGNVEYCKCSSKNLNELTVNSFTQISYANLINDKGWLLQDILIAENIIKIENTGIQLGEAFQIRNGFATLKNEVFVLNVINEDKNYYYTKYKNGEIYKIEKGICRDAIKPNTLKSEKELSDKLEKLLFPYSISTNGCVTVIDEVMLKQKYPSAYEYLLTFKTVLAKRDKEKRTYEQWFAYGRTQALNIVGYKLLFPYLADSPHFVLSEDRNLLFYNGYALISDDVRKLRVVQKILRSNIFWYYIKHTSKPYGSEYYALAKNYVKNFGLVELTHEQEDILLKLKSERDINNYLGQIYNIVL